METNKFSKQEQSIRFPGYSQLMARLKTITKPNY